MDQSDNNQSTGIRVKVDPNITLDCVVGQDEGIAKLRDLVRRIKWPEVYSLWGVSKPKAIALVGPPGVGKTHTIRALANEVDCPLMELKYEDLATHLYDEAIRRLSAFKAQAEEISKEHGHVLILIDEADVFFQSRFDTNSHNSDEKKTNFFLRWIDGDLEGADGFTIIAASNAWDNVDPAMRRSGRFVRIDFKALSPQDLIAAIKVHVQLAEKRVGRKMFDLAGIDGMASSLRGVTGADIKEIIDLALVTRADLHLDLLLQSEALQAADVDPSLIGLITVDDVVGVMNLYMKKQLPNKKGIGFE